MITTVGKRSIHVPIWLGACLVTSFLAVTGMAIGGLNNSMANADNAVRENAKQDERLSHHDTQIGELESEAAASKESRSNTKDALRDINDKLDFLIKREINRAGRSQNK